LNDGIERGELFLRNGETFWESNGSHGVCDWIGIFGERRTHLQEADSYWNGCYSFQSCGDRVDRISFNRWLILSPSMYCEARRYWVSTFNIFWGDWIAWDCDQG
jgi:hypothetical protein